MFVLRPNLLRWLNKNDYVHYFRISGPWQDYLQEAQTTLHQSPEYWASLVPDNQTPWDNAGNEYLQQLEKNQTQGYTAHNTRAWSTHTARPDIVLSFQNAVVNQLPLQHATSRVGCQPPGNVLPWHQDKFVYFKRQFPNEIDFVVRFVIFMQDWQMGHVLQAGDSVITHWKAGDAVLWHPDRWHVSANIGNVNKWTMNITGILSEEFECPIDISM